MIHAINLKSLRRDAAATLAIFRAAALAQLGLCKPQACLQDVSLRLERLDGGGSVARCRVLLPLRRQHLATAGANKRFVLAAVCHDLADGGQ